MSRKPQPIIQPQIAEGRVTFAGIFIAALGALADSFGWTFPKEEAQSFAAWLGANWDQLAEGLGLLVALYGRARINWRHL